MTPKNWTRDELILALDFYFDHRSAFPPQSSEVAWRFSQELRRVAPDLSSEDAAYRNMNAIYMKLANFQALDPYFTSQGRKGLERGGRADAELWNQYASNPQMLKGIALAIKQAAVELPAIDEHDTMVVEADEGRILTRLHTYRERDRRLVTAKKLEALTRVGKLECEVCEVDFGNIYGSYSDAVIEVHHRLPLATLPTIRRTKMSDLAIVCANCHRVIHSKAPWLKIEELREQMRTGS
ncbi:hypothetical protein [Hyphomicrobium sp. ghe19]|uniref:HNH endonuclease n=1 Tax=Hyphomicrobium sp. ghe19 TaxID=2682968 RepID=UPI001366BD94|nr:hypothetical protein HYPP_02989 [Hyphomicrobium sp. ghe19]